MIPLRIEFDPDKRFNGRELVKQIIQGHAVEDNAAITEDILESILKTASDDLSDNPSSRGARLKKVFAAALLRDFRYGNRNYKFLKGVGLNGLYVENYKSSDKIDAL